MNPLWVSDYSLENQRCLFPDTGEVTSCDVYVQLVDQEGRPDPNKPIRIMSIAPPVSTFSHN